MSTSVTAGSSSPCRRPRSLCIRGARTTRIEAFVAQMATHKVACSDVQSMGWGRLTKVELPGGGKLGVYQPRHARP